MSDQPHLLTEEDGAILIVTLNRPEKLNALSGQTMALFEAALHRFRDTRAFKVMLVRAKGQQRPVARPGLRRDHRALYREHRQPRQGND
jgi:enoyl-CoA hydratase/carnithine racemase